MYTAITLIFWKKGLSRLRRENGGGGGIIVLRTLPHCVRLEPTLSLPWVRAFSQLLLLDRA